MNKTIMKYFLIILIAIILYSCDKDNPYPNYGKNSIGYKDDIGNSETLSIFGSWRLIDAEVYFKDSNIYKKHFSESRKVSSLRNGGSEFEIENIEIGVTVWTFTDSGDDYQFWLNYDSTNYYGFNSTSSFMSITESPIIDNTKLGGSARPINVYINDYDEKIIDIYVQEVVERDANYFSRLIFKKIQ